MSDGPLAMEDLMGQTKTRLAQTVRAQARMLDITNRSMALFEWEAGVLADRIRRVTEYLATAPARDVCNHFDPIRTILTEVPRGEGPPPQP